MVKREFRFGLLFVLFTMLVSSTCFAYERYQYVNENSDSKYFFDTTTIRHIPSSANINFSETPYKIMSDNGVIDVWVKFEYTDEGKKDACRRFNRQEDFSYALGHWVFKTNNHELKELSWIEYDSSGRIIDNYNIPPYNQKFDAVVPNSVGEDIYKAVQDYMMKYYSDLKTLPERMKKFEEYQKEESFLKLQGQLTNDYTWLHSDDKRSYFYNAKSIKWIQTYPKLVDVVLKTTYNQEGLQDLTERRSKIGITLNKDVAFVLTHYQINLTERKSKTIGFADYDRNGRILFKVIVPEEKRVWYDLPNRAEIGELIKQLS